jgi:ABC-type antimicrobial peptide transport system permease subunit
LPKIVFVIFWKRLMERHKKILEYTLSSLFRRRYKNLALIAVFSLVVAVISSILFLTHSFKTEALKVLDGTPDLIIQKVSGGRHALIPVEYINRIKGIPGTGDVIPRYWGYYYDSLTGGNYTIIGIDKAITGLTLLDGRIPSEPGECVVGKGISDARFTGIGGELFLTDSGGMAMSFRVVGVFTSESDMLSNDLIVIRKNDVLRLFGMPSDMATDLVVDVYNKSEVSNIAHKVKQMLPDTRPIMKSEIIRTYDTVFNWRSGMILTMFFGAAIAFCILAWDKATGLSADEKQEIGILKAIGWETSDILELKFWEGIIISLTSFLTGLIFAYVHVFFLGAFLLAPALKGWSVLFPSFRLMPYLDLYQVFVLLFLTVVPYVASTIIPSWKSAITDPDVVMRG